MKTPAATRSDPGSELLERARDLTALEESVLASYRDDELDRAHPLRIVLGELANRPGIERLDIHPLSPEAVATLVEPHGLDPDMLFGQTAGNPFYVIEVLAAGGEGIPSTVRDAVLARAARLTTDARTLLVAQGLPNAEIGERLFVSVKTVDHHVSAILRKLGARMRAEASAAAVRLGLAGEDR